MQPLQLERGPSCAAQGASPLNRRRTEFESLFTSSGGPLQSKERAAYERLADCVREKIIERLPPQQIGIRDGDESHEELIDFVQAWYLRKYGTRLRKGYSWHKRLMVADLADPDAGFWIECGGCQAGEILRILFSRGYIAAAGAAGRTKADAVEPVCSFSSAYKFHSYLSTDGRWFGSSPALQGMAVPVDLVAISLWRKSAGTRARISRSSLFTGVRASSDQARLMHHRAQYVSHRCLDGYCINKDVLFTCS